MASRAHHLIHIGIAALGCVLLIIAAPHFAATHLGTVLAADPTQTRPVLPYGESREGTLNDDGTGAFWTLTGQAGTTIVIDMRAADPDEMDPYITLLAPDGSQLALDDDSGPGLDARIGPVVLPEDGDYTIVTASYRGTGTYLLRANDLSAAPTIARDKPLVGVLDTAHPTDYFILDSAGIASESLLRLTLDDDRDQPATSPTEPPPLLTLYAPDGTVISTEFTGGAALDPIAPAPDTRYVIAVDWRTASSGSAYTLTLGPSEIALLAPGIVQRREITLDEHIERHFLRATTGDTIRLHLTRTGGDITPALRVLTADFSHALFTSEGPATQAITITLGIPASGIYVIEVGEGTAQDSTGTYTLSAEWLDAD